METPMLSLKVKQMIEDSIWKYLKEHPVYKQFRKPYSDFLGELTSRVNDIDFLEACRYADSFFLQLRDKGIITGIFLQKDFPSNDYYVETMFVEVVTLKMIWMQFRRGPK